MEGDAIYLNNGMEAVQAKYIDSPLEEFNNPLIQALNPMLDEATIIKKMMVNPPIKEEEKELDNVFRIHILQRLYQFFQPLPIHLEVWNMIHSLIIQSYIARNPFDANYRRYLHATGKQIINRSFDLNSKANFRTTANCGTLIGISGMGKTTSTNRVLSHINQVIVHSEYKGKHFDQIQLVWIKLEAPHNSSLKALCLQFFMKIDELLGTNNFKNYVSRNLSVDAMLPMVAQLARTVCLGLLIIDELQNIRNKGAEQIMNFFVSLINSCGVSIILIGTPASYSIFENELRIARRLTGSGQIFYNNMKKNNEFKFFLESLWKYQWTKKYTPLTDEFIDVIYEETQGISDLVVKIFLNSQKYQIQKNKEVLTTTVFRKVSKEQFGFMSGMLEAVRSGNPYKIAKYQDIQSVKDFNKIPDKTKETPRKVIKERKVESIKNSTVEKDTKSKIEIKKDYIQGDLRLFPLQAKDEDRLSFDLLLENGVIDDMELWIRGNDS
ncbi:ATP-binding protein [Schinkia azotoformans]|uniref:ATP-binding protein n=1 Tax=Schinkia azotoformans TaxID=1454 RepID=UPI002DBDABF8|nr:ATP-binding protein [Schinkia azotoformans]MEC1759896.1 ATP-binding protein [Schinkia azotoformans]